LVVWNCDHSPIAPSRRERLGVVVTERRDVYLYGAGRSFGKLAFVVAAQDGLTAEDQNGLLLEDLSRCANGVFELSPAHAQRLSR
jgi:hypothetical protein